MAGRHGFINGFASARDRGEQKMLLNAVLRFADDGSATAAATDLAHRRAQQQGADGPAQTRADPESP